MRENGLLEKITLAITAHRHTFLAVKVKVTNC